MGTPYLVAIVAVALLAASWWGVRRAARLITIAASYKARVLALIVFGAGRPADGQTEDVSADLYWPLRAVRIEIDRDTRTVVASVAGLVRRTATFPAEFEPRVAAGGVWREGRLSDRVQQVVDEAFTEPNPRRRRRTRAVVVVQDDAIVAERYAPGFSAESRLAGWSMTKGVIAALTGILVGEGRWSLTDRELRPEWRAPDARSAIALEDLLRMRSGLAFSEEYADMSSDVIEMLFNQPDMASYAAGRPLAAPPGTVWNYASGTTNIIAAMMRRTVGETNYPAWPRRALFEPLGMTSAVIDRDASGTFVGSSFMLATARDWARFGQLFLHDGRWGGRQLLPPEWVRFCQSPTPQAADGIYGAHWWLGLKPEIGGGTPAAARIPSDAFFAIGHEAQTLTIIPSRRLVAVRLGLSIYIDAWNQASFVANLLDAC